jgi:predicted RNase H-like nuclease
MKIAGADGCKQGWICVIRNLEDGEIEARVVGDASELLALSLDLAVLTVDIPIGLTDSGRRLCDVKARQVLGWPRRNSVFPAPIRPALGAQSREEASAITSKADGRRVGAQAWAIYPKIKDMDDALRRLPTTARRKIREVHPEVCFWAWRDGAAIEHSKKSPEGKAERRRLVDRDFGPEAFDLIRDRFPGNQVADDDILDAFAALRTAERVAQGTARTLPEWPPVDGEGLTMEMVY